MFLTHAHVGHYSGLIFFGRESYGARELPVYGTERMCAFLEKNAPWSQLVALQQNRARAGSFPASRSASKRDMSVVALGVPHRDELSDTVAFVVSGPNKKLPVPPRTSTSGRSGIERSRRSWPAWTSR